MFIFLFVFSADRNFSHAEIMKLWQAARYNNTYEGLFGEQRSSEAAVTIG